MNKVNRSTSGVLVQLQGNVKALDGYLNNRQLTAVQRELALLKVSALQEVIYFIGMYPLWCKTPKSAVMRFNHWCKPLNITMKISEQTTIKQTKERVEKEILEKIGVNTVESIYRSATLSELVNLVESFRETSGIRYVKRSYLVDLLIFSGVNVKSSKQYTQVHITDVYSILNQSVVTANPKQFFHLFHLEGKRNSPTYGKEKIYLVDVVASIVEVEDPYFQKARLGISLYLQGKISFSDMVNKVRDNVLELEDKLK